MATGDSRRRPAEQDAEALEQKFGEFADVYAETRGEAAEIAGDRAAEKHWEQVAATIDDEDER